MPANQVEFEIEANTSDIVRQLLEVHESSNESACALTQILLLNLTGQLDISRLRTAVGIVISRHELLRARLSKDGHHWLILPEATQVLATFDADNPGGTQACEQQLIDTIESLIATPVNLTDAPIFSAQLFSPTPDDHVLVLRAHSVIGEIDALAVVAADIAFQYRAIDSSETREDPILATQAPMPGTTPKTSLSWWLAQRGNGLRSTRLSENASTTLRSERLDLSVDKAIRDGLLNLAEETQSTLFELLATALAILTARLTGNNDVAIHCAEPNEASAIGQTVQTMAIAMPVDLNATVLDSIAAIKKTLREASQYQVYNLSQLAVQSNRIATSSKSHDSESGATEKEDLNLPTRGIRLNLISTLNPVSLDFEHVACVPLIPVAGLNQYPFDLRIIDANETLNIECQFCPEVFDKQTISFWLGSYRAALSSLFTEPLLPLGVMDIVDRRHEAMIRAFSSSSEAGALTSFDSFSDSLRTKPKNQPAITFIDKTASYNELETLSNQIAGSLAELEIKPGDCVALILESELHRFVVQTACLKSGITYVNLPSLLAPQTQAQIAQLHGANLIVTTSGMPRPTAWKDKPTFLLDSQHKKIAQQSAAPVSRADLGFDIDNQSAAYYQIARLNSNESANIPVKWFTFLSMLGNAAKSLNLSQTDRIVCVESQDQTASQLLAQIATSHGAHALLPSSQALSDGKLLLDWINTHRATAMCAPATVWKRLINAGWPENEFKVIVSGLHLDQDLVASLLDRSATITRVFGCPEASQFAIVGWITNTSEWSILGSPQPNTIVRILDERGQPCPLGAPGEITLGGQCISDGYTDAVLTKTEKFMPDMYSETPASLLFRTGVTGFWTSKGILRVRQSG